MYCTASVINFHFLPLLSKKRSSHMYWSFRESRIIVLKSKDHKKGRLSVHSECITRRGKKWRNEGFPRKKSKHLFLYNMTRKMRLLLQNSFSSFAFKKKQPSLYTQGQGMWAPVTASLRFFDARQIQERVLEASSAFSQRIVKGFSAGQQTFLLTVPFTFPLLPFSCLLFMLNT